MPEVHDISHEDHLRAAQQATTAMCAVWYQRRGPKGNVEMVMSRQHIGFDAGLANEAMRLLQDDIARDVARGDRKNPETIRKAA